MKRQTQQWQPACLVVAVALLAVSARSPAGTVEDSTAWQKHFEQTPTAELTYRYRALDALAKEGRYVDPIELKALQRVVEDRTVSPATASWKALEKDLIGTVNPDKKLIESLKKKAWEYVQEDLKNNVLPGLRDKSDALLEEIKRADSAGEVATFLHKHLGRQNAPKEAQLARFYNDVYQEQGVLAKGFRRRAAEKLQQVGRVDKVADALDLVMNWEDHAKEKIADLGVELELPGVDRKQILEKIDEYQKHFNKLQEYHKHYQSVMDAGKDIPDLSERARNGLRSLAALGIVLDKAGDEIEVPLVKDALKFYGQACALGTTGAEVAQRHVLKEGEIHAVTQREGPYEKLMQETGSASFTMTDLGKATGLRVIQDNDNNCFYIVNDKYERVNKTDIASERVVRDLVAAFDQSCPESEEPLTAEELAKLVDGAQNGTPVTLRNVDYGDGAEYLTRDSALERKIHAYAAKDLYDAMHRAGPENEEQTLSREEVEKRLRSMLWERQNLLDESVEDATRAIHRALDKGLFEWDSPSLYNWEQTLARTEADLERKINPPPPVEQDVGLAPPFVVDTGEPVRSHVEPTEVTVREIPGPEPVVMESYSSRWNELLVERAAESTPASADAPHDPSRLSRFREQAQWLEDRIASWDKDGEDGYILSPEDKRRLALYRRELEANRRMQGLLEARLRDELRESEDRVARTVGVDDVASALRARFGGIGGEVLNWLDHISEAQDEESKIRFEAAQRTAEVQTAARREELAWARTMAEGLVAEYTAHVDHEIASSRAESERTLNEWQQQKSESLMAFVYDTVIDSADRFTTSFTSHGTQQYFREVEEEDRRKSNEKRRKKEEKLRLEAEAARAAERRAADARRRRNNSRKKAAARKRAARTVAATSTTRIPAVVTPVAPRPPPPPPPSGPVTTSTKARWTPPPNWDPGSGPIYY